MKDRKERKYWVLEKLLISAFIFCFSSNTFITYYEKHNFDIQSLPYKRRKTNTGKRH